MPLRIPFSPRLLAISAGVVLLSCSQPLSSCACSPVPPQALVYGRVVDPGGDPVAGVRVVGTMAEGPCTAAAAGEVIGQADTGSNGGYRAFVYDVNPSVSERCLRAQALPGVASGFLPSDSVSFTVRFSQAARPDSVRVDLALRAR